MFNRFKNKKIIISILLTLVVGGFLVAGSAVALETGLEYGTATGLGTADLRLGIMQVVRAILGFVGIIAIAIIVYGGFVWMTAAGNEEKVALAKRIIVNAVIGLVIIFLSFAITTFVINALIEATGAGQGEPGQVCTPDACAGCNLICNSDGMGTSYTAGCNGPAECGSLPTCPKPNSPIPTICSIRSTGNYSAGIAQGAVGEYATAEGWYFGAYEEGTSKVRFDQVGTASIVSCDGTPIWYENGSGASYARFIIPQITEDLHDVDLITADELTSNAITFSVIYDIPKPGLACIIPPSGKNSDILTKAEGIRFGTDPGILGGLIFNSKATSTYSTWTDELISSPVVPALAVSGDVIVKDENGESSNPIYFTVSCETSADCASQCCLYNQCRPAADCLPGPGESCDPDTATPACEPDGACQPGVICDQSNCVCRLPGPGENCDLTEDPACVPGACAGDAVCGADGLNCTCQVVPVIEAVVPNDGAVGNFITIYGRHFGAFSSTQQLFTSLLENTDFETMGTGSVAYDSPTFPVNWWRSYGKYSLVEPSTDQARSGSHSIKITRLPDLEYPGVCGETLCNNLKSVNGCTWDAVVRTCTFPNADWKNFVGPSVYNEGDLLNWGNVNRTMFAAIYYNVSDLDWVTGQKFKVQFYYQGALDTRLVIRIQYTDWANQCVLKSGPNVNPDDTCKQGVPCYLNKESFEKADPADLDYCCMQDPVQKYCYPSLPLTVIPAGDYSDGWHKYTAYFTYTEGLAELLDADGNLQNQIYAYIDYGQTTNNTPSGTVAGTNFYIDDFSVAQVPSISRVVFADGVEADFPWDLNPQCTGSWTDDQIIVAVPAGAQTGPLRVEVENGLADNTNDAFGPVLPDFEKNDTIRPGVCKVVNAVTGEPAGSFNDAVRIYGNNFTPQSETYFGQVIAAGTATITGTEIKDIFVPNVAPGTLGVRVKVGEEFSNPYNFTVSEGISKPVIYGFNPVSGGEGAYVTIIGANFGASRNPAADHVIFKPTGSGPVPEQEANYVFPPECANTVWSDSQIIVRVPAGLSSGIGYYLAVETAKGTADTRNLTPDSFTQDAGMFRANICALLPDNGPIGTNVQIFGQNYQPATITISGVNFYQNISQNVFAFSPVGATDIIATQVPADVITGPVKLLNSAGNESNGLNFSVGACTAGGCAAGKECCAAGLYQGSCMPAGECAGLATDGAYLWTFTTDIRPGNCSADAGLCVADSTLCAPGYTCNPDSCNCEAIPTFECSVDPYVCDPNNRVAAKCPPDKYCDLDCYCKDRVPCDGDTANVTCEPDQDICKTQLGLDWYCETGTNPGNDPCYCYQGIPCDGNISTPACDADNFICRNINPNLTCDTTTCMCQPFAGFVDAAYFWRFNSFSLGPQIVNECNRTADCAKVCALDRQKTCSTDAQCGVDGPCIKAFSSPSPLFWRDGEVAVNSIVSASFTQKVQDQTVVNGTDHPNIKLFKCNQGAILDRLACTIEVSGTVVMFTWNYGTEESEGFDFVPDSTLGINTWYQAVVTDGVIGENGLKLAHSPAYSWEFKTVNSALNAEIGCIGCQPGLATLRARFNGACDPGDLDCQDYLGSAWDQDRVCVVLDPRSFGWNWELLNESTADRASFLLTQTAITDPSVFAILSSANQSTVYARKETTPEDPVKVQNTSPQAPPSAYLYGDNICDLFIDYSTPVVVKRWPDCGAACMNASVGAAFNVAIDQTTLTYGSQNSGYVIYGCADNADCRPGYGSCSRSGLQCNSDADCTEAGETCAMLFYDPVLVPISQWKVKEGTINGWPHASLVDPMCYDTNSDGTVDYCLLPNTYYRVIIHDSIKSAEGKKLGNLNYKDVLCSTCNQTKNNAHSWVFKTSDAMCSPGRIGVNPAENWLDILQIDRYWADPFAAADACDPDGQPLIASSFTWEWQSSECRVADFLLNILGGDNGFLNTHTFVLPPTCTQVNTTAQWALLRNGCGNGFVGAGEDCDDSNLINGDGCSDTCQNEGSGFSGAQYTEKFDGAEVALNNSPTPFAGSSLSSYVNKPLVTNDYPAISPGSEVLSAWGADTKSGISGGAIFTKSDAGHSMITTATHPLIYSKYGVRAMVRTPASKTDTDDAGLAFGYVDKNNYYEFFWKKVGYPDDADSQRLVLMNVTGGVKTELTATAKAVVNDGQWHELSVIVYEIGTTGLTDISGYFDGQLMVATRVVGEVKGFAGVFSLDSDGFVYFDNLELWRGVDQAVCGNGNIEIGEDCDDSYDVTNGCNEFCLNEGNTNYVKIADSGYTTAAVCGNRVVETGEQCDIGTEPNGDDSDGCTDSCTLSGSALGNLCGNYAIDRGEQCDDGELSRGQVAQSGDGCTGLTDTKGCSTATAKTSCDNKMQWCHWTGKECLIRPCLSEANGVLGNTNYSAYYCGNGQTEPGEECDYGSFCQTSAGTVAACNSLNASQVCDNGICGSRVCVRDGGIGLTTCSASLASQCETDVCGLEPNATFTDCTNNCLHAGSLPDGRSRQIVKALDDGITKIQAWTTIFPPSAQGPLGEGNLTVGDGGYDGPVVIEKWPDCTTACINAAVGARFNMSMNISGIGSVNYDGSIINSNNIKFYECDDADSACSPLTGIYIPIILEAPFSLLRGDNIQFTYPAYHGGYLLPDTTYRVIIHDAVTSVGEPKKLGNLNYDDFWHTDHPGRDSYSWTFKTQSAGTLCLLGRVTVNPPYVSLPPDNVMIYFAQPWSAPDACSPTNGQRINPWFYDWSNWLDAAIDGPDAADMVTPLRDGCGNSIVEWGEDCDDGNLDIDDGCSATCQHEGSTDGCGNNILDYGEDCEGNLGGTICSTNGRSCDPANAAATCPGGSCRNYCSTDCLWTGVTVKAPHDVCGNGEIEGTEECDMGNEANGDDSDGCTDTCRLAGAIPGLGSTCGNGKIELGEECDVVSGTCTSASNPPSVNCAGAAGADACRSATLGSWCYWTGNACIIRECLRTDFGSKGNSNWRQSVCGNEILEPGEECDWGDNFSIYPDLGCNPLNCLNDESIYKDGRKDPYQFVKTKEPSPASLLEQVRMEIRTWATGQPDIVGVADLDVYLGLKVPFSVIGHQPLPDDGNDLVCRNVAIWTVFSRELNQDTIADNIALNLCSLGDQHEYASCGTENYIGSYTYQPVLGRCVAGQCDYGDAADVDNRPFGQCLLDFDCIGSKVEVTSVKGNCSNDQKPCDKNDDCGAGNYCNDPGFLASNSSYQLNIGNVIELRRCTNGYDTCTADSDCGAGNTCTAASVLQCGTANSATACQWDFSSSDEFCECNYVGVKIDYTSPGLFTIKDAFTCAGNDCGAKTYSIFDDDYLSAKICGSGPRENRPCIVDDDCGAGNTCDPNSLTVAGNQHQYNAQCLQLDLESSMPMSPSGLLFNWTELDPASLIYLAKNNITHNCSDVRNCLVAPGEDDPNAAAMGVPKGKNGESEVVVTANEYKWEGTNDFCQKTTAYKRCANSFQECNQDSDCGTNVKCLECKPAVAALRTVNITNFICDNPWPPVIPWADDGSHPCLSGSCNPTNFAMYYCRDKGQPGFDDDLPAMSASPVIHGERAGVSVKDFIFPFGGELIKGPIEPAIKEQSDSPAAWEDAVQNSFTVPADGNYAVSIYTKNYYDDLSQRVTEGRYPGHLVDIYLKKNTETTYQKIGTITQPPKLTLQKGSLALGKLTAGIAYQLKFVWTNDWCACNWCPVSQGLANLCDANIHFEKWEVTSAQPNADAIGIQVLPNLLHLSPLTWYNTGFCGGVQTLANLCVSGADCGGKNLVANGDMENGLVSPWAVINDSGISSSNVFNKNAAHSGEKGWQLTITAIPASTWGVQFERDIDLPVGTYSLSAYVRSDATVSVHAQDVNQGYKRLCSNANCALTADSQGEVCNSKAKDSSNNPVWEKVTCNFSLTNPATIRLTANGKSTGLAQIDDVVLTSGCVKNVPNPGTPQQLVIDGYRAVLDGRSIYVGATDKQSALQSEIYLISYNLGASGDTQEIFSRIFDPAGQTGKWEANINLSNHRVCQTVGKYSGSNYFCTAYGAATGCEVYQNDQDCSNQAASGCVWNTEVKLCQGRACLPLYCTSNFDCPDFQCDVEKDAATRDNIRYGDLRDIQLALNRYSAANGGKYPALGGGTYIASTTFSVWPSWQQTFGAALGGTLFTDPLNRFRGCSAYFCDVNENGAIDDNETVACALGTYTVCNSRPELCRPQDPDQETTCWDEITKTFGCPGIMNVYAYHASQNNLAFQLYTTFEYLINGFTPATQVYALPAGCSKLNFEITEAKAPAVGPAANCTNKRCYNGTVQSGNVSCVKDSDCTGPGAICSGDADSDGICDISLTDNCAPNAYCKQHPSQCYNPDQRDSDGDGAGDVCDPNCSGDADSDGICDEADNCRTVYNRGQQDADIDGIGDACDPCTDTDKDGWWDVLTPATDEGVCKKDNCPKVAGFTYADDRPGYCRDASGNPLASKPCCRDGVDCGGSYPDCDDHAYCQNGAIDSGASGYNPLQEDYDNDGHGNICDFCLDFDNDGKGDFTFYTHDTSFASAAGLTANQQQHFKGCDPTTAANYTGFEFSTPDPNNADCNLGGPADNDVGFDDSDILCFAEYLIALLPNEPTLACPIPVGCNFSTAGEPPVVINNKDISAYADKILLNNKLDNCPGGPFAGKCYDKFNIEIPCTNPVTEWTDIWGNTHTGSQPDTNLNGIGDICDPWGDGVVDPNKKEKCDCGIYPPPSNHPSNKYECTTLNNVSCEPPEGCETSCQYCAWDPLNGSYWRTVLNKITGDAIIQWSCNEGCDCGDLDNPLFKPPADPFYSQIIDGLGTEDLFYKKQCTTQNGDSCRPGGSDNYKAACCFYCSEDTQPRLGPTGGCCGDGTLQRFCDINKNNILNTAEAVPANACRKNSDCGGWGINCIGEECDNRFTINADGSWTSNNTEASGCTAACKCRPGWVCFDPDDGEPIIPVACECPALGWELGWDCPDQIECQGALDEPCNILSCPYEPELCGSDCGIFNDPAKKCTKEFCTGSGGEFDYTWAADGVAIPRPCTDTTNNGCCNADGQTGETSQYGTASYDWGCPLEAGGKITLRTVADGNPVDHPVLFLSQKDIPLVSNIIIADKDNPSSPAQVFWLSKAPVNDKLCAGPTNALNLRVNDESGEKIGRDKFEIIGGSFKGGWVGLEAGRPNQNFCFVHENKDSTEPFNVGDIIFIRSFELDNDQGQWSIRWNDGSNPGAIGATTNFQGWEKLKICDPAGFCGPCTDDLECATSLGEVCCDGICFRPECLNNNECDDGNGCTDDTCDEAATCDAQCQYSPPETSCSGGTKDQCCPVDTGGFPLCSAAPGPSYDVDCDCGICDNNCPPDAICHGLDPDCGPGANPLYSCVPGNGCCGAGCNYMNDKDCPIRVGDIITLKTTFWGDICIPRGVAYRSFIVPDGDKFKIGSWAGFGYQFKIVPAMKAFECIGANIPAAGDFVKEGDCISFENIASQANFLCSFSGTCDYVVNYKLHIDGGKSELHIGDTVWFGLMSVDVGYDQRFWNVEWCTPFFNNEPPIKENNSVTAQGKFEVCYQDSNCTMPTACIPNGCSVPGDPNACPQNCSIVEDPDCGCFNDNGCCAPGCVNANDNDCILPCPTTAVAPDTNCDGVCPPNCTAAEDYDCGCVSGNGCCGISSGLSCNIGTDLDCPISIGDRVTVATANHRDTGLLPKVHWGENRAFGIGGSNELTTDIPAATVFYLTDGTKAATGCNNPLTCITRTSGAVQNNDCLALSPDSDPSHGRICVKAHFEDSDNSPGIQPGSIIVFEKQGDTGDFYSARWNDDDQKPPIKFASPGFDMNDWLVNGNWETFYILNEHSAGIIWSNSKNWDYFKTRKCVAGPVSNDLFNSDCGNPNDWYQCDSDCTNYPGECLYNRDSCWPFVLN